MAPVTACARAIVVDMLLEAYNLLVDRLENVDEFDREHRIQRIARDGGRCSCEEFVVGPGGEGESVVGDEQ